MEIKKRELEILKNNFKVCETEKECGLEAWTDGGVNMFIDIDKCIYKNVIEQLEDYVEKFDVDEEIDLYRQYEDYRNNFKISESLKDFEDWINFIETVIKDLKGEE